MESCKAKRQKLEDAGAVQGDHDGAQGAPEEQVESYVKLPKEIWLHVFSFLPAQPLLLGAALVCKDWHRMVLTQEKHLQEVTFVPASVTAAKACRLICLMPELKRVRLHHWKTSVDVILRTVAKELPGLAVIDMNHVVIRNRQSLGLVAQSCCQSLREVRLDRSSCECRRLRHILDTFSNCPKLEKLIMVDTYFSRDMLSMGNFIGREWSKLTDVHFGFFVSETALKIVIDTVGGQLRRLRVSSVGVRYDPFLALGQCHQLEELIIDKASEVKQTTLVEVIGNLPNLRRLELRCPFHATVENNLREFFSLAQVATRLESLKFHNCRGLTDFCMSAIASKCLELTHVTFSGCYGFTYAGFYEVISQCTKLKTVSVPRCCRCQQDMLFDPACRFKKVLELNANIELTTTEEPYY